jgi:hypothetical protein
MAVSSSRSSWASFWALGGISGSAPPKQPQTDVAANASNETAQAVKDLQTTEQKIAGQMQSLQQAIASNQAETKQTLAAEQEAGLIKAVDAGREAKPAGDSP